MVEPNPRTLRRRAKELREAAEREVCNDHDAAALLIFYAAECGLKAHYLDINYLDNTSASTTMAESARSFKHDLPRLVQALRIPAAAIGDPPSAVFKRTGQPCPPTQMHEAWRYGEKVEDTPALYTWLKGLVDWASKSA